MTDPRAIWVAQYGARTFADLFTPRQLAALETFSDLIGEARERVRDDAGDDYAAVRALYLAFAVSKVADRNSAICTWIPLRDHARNTFARQAVPMSWEYAEANPLCGASGGWDGMTRTIQAAMEALVGEARERVRCLEALA